MSRYRTPEEESLRDVLEEILKAEWGESPPIRVVQKALEVTESLYKEDPPQVRTEMYDRLREVFGAKALGEAMGVDVATPPLRSAPRPRDDGLEKIIGNGWLGRYLEYTQEAEAPAPFHVGAVLTCASAAIGRSVKLGWEARDTWLNLYTLLIGPSGARKGAAIDYACGVIGSAKKLPLIGNEGTHQGFAAALRRGTVLRGAAEGLILSPEFSVLVSRDKNKADLAKWLTDWYDCPELWERSLRGEEHYVLQGLYVTLLGGSNLAWLKDMPKDAVTGGFLPRCWIFAAEGRRHRKARPRFSELLRRELETRAETNLNAVCSVMEFDAETARYLDHWYEVELEAEYRETEDEALRAWLDRKQANVLKLAAVWQLLDGGPRDVLVQDYLQRARQLADWTGKDVQKVYSSLGVTEEGEVVDELEGILRRAPGGKLSERTILRRLRNKYRASRLKDALETLRRGRIAKSEINALEGVTWELIDSEDQ
jgi:hypothetical protein